MGYNLGEDCPVFENLFEFCQIYAGGTIDNLPLLVTGGGGYTKENVARCWTVETGVLLDTELPNEIPENEYIKYFAPDYSLKSPGGLMENLNSKSYLSTIKMQVLENLRCIQHAPSVQMQEVS
ncbi:histone deacetylase 17-like [Populus alba]|uniref:histone deacetylase 17-like n=1 Tax=Populus alba TaxID=43335 RepID=UPI00158EED34|nr:histone deacetylase 9-like [Populus alba]